MKKSKPIPSEIILYQAEEGKFQIALSRDTDSIWLNPTQIADLYQTSVPNISMHIRKILADGELDTVSTVKNYLTVQTEKNRQVRRNISFYSLDMILSIGYRVRSERGTQFRIWATQHLSEFLKKGFFWLLTITPKARLPSSSLPQCKTGCSMPPQAIQPQR